MDSETTVEKSQDNLASERTPFQETTEVTEQARDQTFPIDQLKTFGLPEKKADPLGESESLISASAQECALAESILKEMNSAYQKPQVEFLSKLVEKGEMVSGLVRWATFNSRQLNKLVEHKRKKIEEVRKKLSQNEGGSNHGVLYDINSDNDKDRQELVSLQQQLIKAAEEFPQEVKAYQELLGENKQWQDFIDGELSSSLGISTADQAKWLESQPEEIKEVGNRSFENIRLVLALFAARLHQEKGLDKQQVKALITQEVARIKDQVFISINMNIQGALEFSQRKAQLPLTSLPLEVFKKRAQKHNLLGDIDGYLARRKDVGDNLRYSSFPEGFVATALTSPNGRSEVLGGAPLYGDVFLVLDQEKVGPRVTYTLGDSMNPSLMQQILGGEIIRDPKKHMLDRQLILPHAIIAEGVLNIMKPMIQQGRGWAYVEALVYGGFTLDEVKTVNVPSQEVLRAHGVFINPREVQKLRQAYNGKLRVVK